LMYAAKTVPTDTPIEAFLNSIADPARQADCRTLVTVLSEVTEKPAVMWGSAIVGFGSYRYRYASGHSGETVAIGFAIRSAGLTLYLSGTLDSYADQLARLGPHKTGKGCLYIKRLSDVDESVLREIAACSLVQSRLISGDVTHD